MSEGLKAQRERVALACCDPEMTMAAVLPDLRELQRQAMEALLREAGQHGGNPHPEWLQVVEALLDSEGA